MSPPIRWPREHLAQHLADGLLNRTEVRCQSENDARLLRRTLYDYRRKIGATDCQLTIVGSSVIITPTRNPLMETI